MKSTLRLLLTALLISLCACASKNKDTDAGTSSRPEEANPLVPRAFGPNYKYNELMIKDYDQMLGMVQGMVRKAHDATSKEESSANDGEAVEWLGRALKLIFSRPDSDNMVAKLVGEVRRDLQGFNAYEDVINGIAAESLGIAQNDDAPVITQSTALVVLENIMAEVRPEVQNGNQSFRHLVERVKAANLKISDGVKKDRRMRGMFRTTNPSDEARDILKSLAKKK